MNADYWWVWYGAFLFALLVLWLYVLDRYSK